MIDIKIDVGEWECYSIIESLLEKNPEISNQIFSTIENDMKKAVERLVNEQFKHICQTIFNDTLEQRVRTNVDNYLNCPIYGCSINSMVKNQVDSRIPDLVKHITESKLTKIVEKLKNE